MAEQSELALIQDSLLRRMRTTFSPQGITVLAAFERWHYRHGLRPRGEIELARGFLGLGGMTA